MTDKLMVLMITAASIGFFHTLFGPDHYVPFIVMAKSRKWSYIKTIFVTGLCGIGHVGSSVVLGMLGVMLGFAVEKLEIFESMRGEWAAWALIGFGLMYFVYGIRQAILNKPHTHGHIHGDGNTHVHEHTHHGTHAHVHQESALIKPVPWALFVIFVLGPCEPLIPLLMYPAAQKSFTGMLMVAGIFSLMTIATMLGVVLLGTFGLNFLPLRKVERFSHVLAGFAILLCGCAIQFLGL
jgi:nickel/cobalt exporter